MVFDTFVNQMQSQNKNKREYKRSPLQKWWKKHAKGKVKRYKLSLRNTLTKFITAADQQASQYLVDLKHLKAWWNKPKEKPQRRSTRSHNIYIFQSPKHYRYRRRTVARTHCILHHNLWTRAQHASRQAYRAAVNTHLGYNVSALISTRSNTNRAIRHHPMTFDSDSCPILVDNCCITSITNDLDDFIEPPRPVSTYIEGYSGHAIICGRYDICFAVSVLSAFSAAPRKGHLERVYHLVGYLRKFPKK